MPLVASPPSPIAAKPAQRASTTIAPQFDLYGWLVDPSKFRPLFFFLGIVIAIACCSFAGRVVASKNIYQNFHRFHPFINPTSLFYPTASQMISLAEANSSPEQTIVILGGNSIFYGLGQSVSELWSTTLQKKLGSNFAVLNFAMPGANAFDGAYWAAEALLKKNRKVIFATVAMPTLTGAPDGSDVYGYEYWDAKEKHLLFHDKGRDALADAQLPLFPDRKKTRLEELRLRSRLDSIFYFEDLWNTVGYNNIFTVWTGLTATSPLKARKYFDDAERPSPFIPLTERFTAPLGLASVVSCCRDAFETDSSRPSEAYWYRAAAGIQQLAPDPVKRNCLVVVATHAPGSLKLLSATENERDRIGTLRSVSAWQQCGFKSVTLRGKLVSDDFMDCRHLLPSGGMKVADVVAVQVEEMNRVLYGD